MTQFNDVQDFHNKFGLSSTGTPKSLETAEQKFRIKCLYEELQEYERAVFNKDLPEQLDALIDLVYFALGTAHRSNFPFDHGFSRVHQANMQKLMGENGVEIIKLEDWQHPDMTELVSNNDYFTSLKNNRGLITVDGVDGSGKTTLAKRIAQLYGGEHIHLTWTPRLDKVMDAYRTSAIEYATALARDRVVVLERPWLSHPIYSHVYRNDVEHDWKPWRDLTETHQCLGIIALPGDGVDWYKTYIQSCETRNEHYSKFDHAKMLEVFKYFDKAFNGGSLVLGIEGLDRTTHIQYDYQRVDPVNGLDSWIDINVKEHLGVK